MFEVKETNESAKAILPFVIEITNTSEDKFYNVPLINFLDNQDEKIQYKGMVDNKAVSHKQLAEQLKSHPQDISMTYITVFGDYNKYVMRQLIQTGYVVSENAKKEQEAKMPFSIGLDPMQMQSNIILSRIGYKVGEDKNGVLHNLVFERLMPEVKMLVRIYPTEKINLEKN